VRRHLRKADLRVTLHIRAAQSTYQLTMRLLDELQRVMIMLP
jgi:hypothetical protein